jgi:hypothetical protein
MPRSVRIIGAAVCDQDSRRRYAAISSSAWEGEAEVQEGWFHSEEGS